MSEKDYPNERDCEHGHLRRSCPICAAEADYAALLARHNALVEAVAWERETDECGEWLHLAWWDNPKINLLDIWDIHSAARVEVDRLLEEK